MPLRVVAVDVESSQRFTGYSILLLGRSDSSEDGSTLGAAGEVSA